MKKTSKLLSGCLAIAMLASMSLSSFAAGPGTGTAADVEDGKNSVDLANAGTKITITGTVKTPAVKIKLPATMDIWYNPYGLDVDSNGLTDQIVTADLKIQNLSDTDVAIYAKSLKATPPTTTTKGAEVKLLTKAPTAADTTKSAMLVMRTVVGDAAAPDPDTISKDVTTIKAATATTEGDIVISATDLKAEVLVAKLEKANSGSATNKGTCITKIVGAMTQAPTYPWTADDKIDVEAIFTVKPTTIPTK